MRGTVPGAVNIPYSSAFSPDGDLVKSSAVLQLYSHRGKLVIVVGNRGNHVPNVSTSVARAKYIY